MRHFFSLQIQSLSPLLETWGIASESRSASFRTLRNQTKTCGDHFWTARQLNCHRIESTWCHWCAWDCRHRWKMAITISVQIWPDLQCKSTCTNYNHFILIMRSTKRQKSCWTEPRRPPYLPTVLQCMQCAVYYTLYYTVYYAHWVSLKLMNCVYRICCTDANPALLLHLVSCNLLKRIFNEIMNLKIWAWTSSLNEHWLYEAHQETICHWHLNSKRERETHNYETKWLVWQFFVTNYKLTKAFVIDLCTAGNCTSWRTTLMIFG